MSWLHTWLGVALGGVLFVVFWMGTLSVFDREIDRWMAPISRLELPVKLASLDKLLPFYESAVAAKAATWFVALPSEREPVFRIAWRASSSHHFIGLLHPQTVDVLPDLGTRGGSGFLYPLHYKLLTDATSVGYWLVGAAGMAMLGLCVTGVFTHRRIFASFFVLRPDKSSVRLILDLHNASGVLTLPFAFSICISGLIIHWFVYFPSAVQTAYHDDAATFRREVFGIVDRPVASHPAKMMSLDALVDRARSLWKGDSPSYLLVHHPGDAAAFVQMGRASHASVGDSADIATFDASTGDLVHLHGGETPIIATRNFIAGLHLIQFCHWTLRWLYFGLGLLSCVTIATGYLFWLQSRRRRHTKPGLNGVRIVNAMAVGAITGTIIATVAFLIANRLLPSDLDLEGYPRATLEIWLFYIAWLGALFHAAARPRSAWAEQCWMISALAIAAIGLNWITTGDHIGRTLFSRHLWPIAGVDLVLGVSAFITAFTALEVRRRNSGHRTSVPT